MTFSSYHDHSEPVFNNYCTRNSSLLHKKSFRTNYTKHTHANNGIEVWNNLPTQYKKKIKSYSTFKQFLL